MSLPNDPEVDLADILRPRTLVLGRMAISDGLLVEAVPPRSLNRHLPMRFAPKRFLPLLGEGSLWLAMLVALFVMLACYQYQPPLVISSGVADDSSYFTEGWSAKEGSEYYRWTAGKGTIRLPDFAYPIGSGDYQISLVMDRQMFNLPPHTATGGDDYYYAAPTTTATISLAGLVVGDVLVSGDHQPQIDPDIYTSCLRAGDPAFKCDRLYWINLNTYTLSIPASTIRAFAANPVITISSDTFGSGNRKLGVKLAALAITPPAVSGLLLPRPAVGLGFCLFTLLCYLTLRRRKGTRYAAIISVLISIGLAALICLLFPAIHASWGLLGFAVAGTFGFALFAWRHELADWLSHLRRNDAERCRSV